MKFYQVDAFTSHAFAGNPAVVYVLDHPIHPARMQDIAREHNLSETAFVQNHGLRWSIRWFTPTAEVKLCGHATLAAAKVLSDLLGVSGELIFDCLSGELIVNNARSLIQLDFPAKPIAAAQIPEPISEFASAHNGIVQGFSGRDWLVLMPTQAAVEHAQPNLAALAKLPEQTLCITGEGDDCDFVSRFFAPALGVSEDPVTGSAHCMLAPFWAERLGRTDLLAQQLSERGGEVSCRVSGDRVILQGEAVVVMQGELLV
ncbi:PhzF family phenazine biosynthesis protein [Salinibius halmophilus]|uniref:PhzF family phenazine biosynthesis protein n=1 Tax=Salinibius halmophilus TaxID=1853216 RepID=UPI000E6764C6|nr:PhzF family phenazine biosynthesis protein [Salinibius halmophilus]